MSEPASSPASLTSAQLEELRALLLAKRAELDRKRVRRPDSAPENPADPADAASDATIDAETRGLAARDQQLMKEIDRALAKCDAGTFGVSEESGESIGYGRLRIVPWARRAVDEEELREKRRR